MCLYFMLAEAELVKHFFDEIGFKLAIRLHMPLNTFSFSVLVLALG